MDMKELLSQVKAANGEWFSRGNKQFFNDVSYRAYYGERTGKPYLVRSTYAWTDMLGGAKSLHWRINNVNQDTLEIESLIDEIFPTLSAVKDWLKNN
jgi:hypothetical protein